MKAWELKKINEFAIKNNISLDYENLLGFEQEDINKVIEAINKRNMHVESLIAFINWEVYTPNWQLDFEHLEGIENFDIKEYLIKKILTASSKEQATAILESFDFDNQPEKLKLFKTIEEWKVYIDNINEIVEERQYLVMDNITFILEKVTEDRCTLIKQVMEYSEREDIEPLIFREYFSENITEKELKEELPPLIKEYKEKDQKNILSTSTNPTYEHDVKLVTVLELLEYNHNIDEVLAGFNDDEEITPKTLIRTMTYKNN